MLNYQTKMSRQVSRIMDISKFIAIASVITAHRPLKINNHLLYNIVGRFSSIGVIVFIYSKWILF